MYRYRINFDLAFGITLCFIVCADSRKKAVKKAMRKLQPDDDIVGMRITGEGLA